MQSMWNAVGFMTHFVVKVMQLYFRPETQQTIILMGQSFYTCSWYRKILNTKILIVSSNLHKYLEKTLFFQLKSKFVVFPLHAL